MKQYDKVLWKWLKEDLDPIKNLKPRPELMDIQDFIRFRQMVKEQWTLALEQAEASSGPHISGDGGSAEMLRV